MKKLLFIVLISCWSIAMMAGNVTPEEAMKQATNFVKERVAKGSRRAPSASAQLTMAKQVSGLYVINVGKNEGFVIVSPDDRTTSILGYADSGNLNPDNMPNNMRAWLQGYADEIVWLNKHNFTKAKRIASNRASVVKTPIAPLVESRWNQGAPYNNQVSSTTYFSEGGAVTGCVATAMAQVMYYTAKKAGLTTTTTSTDMPTYDTSSGSHIPAISAGETINWSKMRNTYTESDTDEGADAVATLMRCCGVSVKMDYSTAAYGGSSANSDIIDYALKNYFGYETTTQYVDRSYYSYRNWIDLLYHELSQERAILYCGQSTGGGHEFVCDGYQGEDYFHINWGWGGKSDNYFKLSVLDPDEQGIGGSTSTEGYNFGQSAVVGIQLAGGTGTVLSNPNTVNLKLNSVAASKTSMTTDETINITFNITNNSSDDYDGEIGLNFIDYSLGDGKMFLIPAGETKDCVVEFSPKATGTYKITAYKPNGSGRYGSIDASKYVTVTVTAGSSPLPNSSDLDLTTTLKSLENSNASKTEVYGDDVKAVITISNPSTTTNFKGTFKILLRDPASPSWYTGFSKKITVPANGSVDVEFVKENQDLNDNYYITTSYIRTGSTYTSEVKVGNDFQLLPGIFSYTADGTMTAIKATSSYAAPASAVVVDLSDAGVTSVTKNSNPNCLYILKTTDVVPSGLTNVITTDGSAYTAANIALTDGSDFYSPIDFTATNIEFTYNNDRWADGTSGWNTIILPFDVTQVTANGTAIDWFHSSTDTGKQFWLKEFTSDAVGVVNFGFANEMKANTPYIIALPGNHWGDAFDLSSKTIKFIGSNVEVKKSEKGVITASNYRFIGNTQANNTANIYCINATGNKFELKATGGSPAFRPFFKADIFDRTITSLGIGGSDDVTSIKNIKVGSDNNVYYDLNGHRVLYPKKGLYIMNGKKVIIK